MMQKCPWRSERGREYYPLMVSVMVSEFGITEEEATGRINDLLGDWEVDDPDFENALGHQDPEYWAYEVYYGYIDFWWNQPAEKLTPRPWSPT